MDKQTKFTVAFPSKPESSQSPPLPFPLTNVQFATPPKASPQHENLTCNTMRKLTRRNEKIQTHCFIKFIPLEKMYHRSGRANFDQNFIRMTRITMIQQMMTVTIGHGTMMMTVTMVLTIVMTVTTGHKKIVSSTYGPNQS